MMNQAGRENESVLPDFGKSQKQHRIFPLFWLLFYIGIIIEAYPTLYDLYEAAYVICVTMVSQGNRCTIS